MTSRPISGDLPAQVPGTIEAKCGPELLVYSGRTASLHVLSPSASILWEACEQGGPVVDLVASIVGRFGVDPATVSDEVSAGLQHLEAVGIVTWGDEADQPHPGVEEDAGEGEPVPPVDLVVRDWTAAGADPARLVDEASFDIAVLGDVLRVVGTDRAALRRAQDLLAGLATSRPPTRTLLVDVLVDERRSSDTGAGAVHDGVRQWGPTAGYRSFADVTTWLAALPTELNRLVRAQRSMVVVHAGAVVSPAGRTLIVPATSGSGKSTLTGALVQRGWRYVTDEAVGVRNGTLELVPYPKPLVLGPEVRALLGVSAAVGDNVMPDALVRPAPTVSGAGASASVEGEEVPLPSAILTPTFEVGERPEAHRVGRAEVAGMLAANSFNLERQGVDGLRTIAALVENVPGFRFVHGGAPMAATWLTEWIESDDFE